MKAINGCIVVELDMATPRVETINVGNANPLVVFREKLNGPGFEP